MIDYSFFIHTATIATLVASTSVSVGIGQGIVGKAALKALNIQPTAEPQIGRTLIFGLALLETTGIVTLIVSLILLLGHQSHTVLSNYGELGILLALAIPGSVIGVVAAFPAREALLSVARQPFFSQKIQNIMILTLSLMQTPLILAFIVALFIRHQLPSLVLFPDSVRLIAAGLCIGLGSIGPSVGLSTFAKQVCNSVGFNTKAYGQLVSYTLISEALIESPLIFSFLVAILLLQKSASVGNVFPQSMLYLAAAIAMGLGTFGPGMASGRLASAACKEIGKEPSLYSTFFRTSLLGQVFIETMSIYSLLVAIFILLSKAF